MSYNLKNNSILQQPNIRSGRGGTSQSGSTIFGVECDQKVADIIAHELSDLRVDFGQDESFLDILPPLPPKEVCDLRAEIDKLYGKGVSAAILSLGYNLSPAIVCGCGKLGTRTSILYPNLVCERLGDACKKIRPQVYQDLHPTRVARIIASMTGRVSLGTNSNFMEMLGAMAGYPFKCGCGNLVHHLDAPLTVCDFCAADGAALGFIKHMVSAGESEESAHNDDGDPSPAEQGAIRTAYNNIARTLGGGIGAVKDKLVDVGSSVYGMITEFITSISNYFNSVFQHYGSHFYTGIQSSFKKSVRGTALALKRVLSSEGFAFLFVAVVVSVILKFGAEMIANFVITTTLSLFDMLKDVSESIFGGFLKIYKTIADRLRKDKEDDDDSFTKHGANSDGCIALIATMFCTFATSAGPLSGVNVMRALSSARHVVSGVQVAQSGLLWLVEKMPIALQSYLWDVSGVGNFECDDYELMQLIVVMRECLLKLRKHPAVVLADVGSCKIFLTAHVMLTRAVTKNKHGWNAAQNSILRAMLAESREFVARAQSCVDNDYGRIEPVGLILQGPPGIGKTALIEVLSAKLNPDVPRCARIYSKNLNEQFWSGYAEQPVLVIDDYGAVKNEQAETALAADLLRIISPTEMALNTPFGDKGTVFCKSSLVVITTNRDMNAPQKFLTSNKAFMRRFLYCTVSIAPEYQDVNGLLHSEKLKALPVEASITFPHLRFRIHEHMKMEGEGSAGIFHLSHQERTLDELLVVLQAMVLKKQADAKFLHEASARVAPPGDTQVHVDLKQEIVDQIIDDDDHISKPVLQTLAGEEVEKLYSAGPSWNKNVGCLGPDFELHMAVDEFATAPEESEDEGDAPSLVRTGWQTSSDEKDPRDLSGISGGESVDSLAGDYIRRPAVSSSSINPNYETEEPCSGGGSSTDCWSDGVYVGPGTDAYYQRLTNKHIRALVEAEESETGVVYKHVRHAKSKHGKTSGGNRMGVNTRRRIRKDLEARRHSANERPEIDEFGRQYESDDIAERATAFLTACSKIVYVKHASLKDQTDKFKGTITKTALEVLSKIRNHPLRSLASILACATTLGICIKAFKMVTEPKHQSQMRTKYNSDHVRRRPEIANRRRFTPIVRHIDSSTDKAVISKVAANCGYLDRVGGRVGCFFVKGNIFRTVAHFFKTTATSDGWLPDGTPFSVFAREGENMVEYKMSFSMDFVLPFEDDDGLVSDWLYYNCGTKVPPKKDMTHMHVSESLFTHRRDFRTVIMVRTDSVSRGTNSLVRSIAGSPALRYPSVDGMKRPDVYVPTAITSDYECDFGDCGYPVIGKVDGQYKILSLHVGVGSRPLGNQSTSAVVTISEVQDCLSLVSKGEAMPIVLQGLLRDVTPSTPRVELNDSYTHCGKLDWAPSGISSKTKYQQSLIYNYVEKKIIYEPSIMGDKADTRTTKTPKQVLAEIANRADASLAVMPKHLVQMAGDALFESITTAIPVNETTRIVPLSLKEALNGDGGFVDRYPTAGSPGLPTTLKRSHGVTGKHGIMTQDPDGVWYISDPECAARIEHLHASFSRGIVEPYINQFCIKDETLKCDDSGNVKKTRGIKCAPFEANVCGKMYFGGMVSLFKGHFWSIPFKCGMNVFSQDWDEFIKWHLDVGEMGFDGDIGGQENIIKGEIYDELYRFTDRIYAHYGDTPTEEERKQRASYLSSLCHYYMVIGPDLFRAKFGNPSGNWLTSFICSFTSGILLGVAYFGLALKHDPMKANRYCFLQLVRMSLSGDDNFVSRSSLLDWFTGPNVSAYLAENYGYKYTDAKKAADFPPDRRVVELNFLACNTRLCDDYSGIRYMACVDDGPLEKCVQYISRKAAKGDEYIAISDNANTALGLVWTSGKKRFDHYRAKYLKAFSDTPNCKVPVLHDFAYCEQRFLTGNLLSEDYFGDDYLFLPQMLKSPEQVNPEFQDAQVVVEAGPGGSIDTQVTYQGTESTVLEPSKRFTSMYDCPEQKGPVPSFLQSVSGAFVTREPVNGDSRPMAGPLAWFAGPFAAWSGDLRLAVKCSSELLIRTDATERLANTGVPPKAIRADISGMAPFDYTSANQQWAMLQIPSTIPYKFNVLPKITGEEKYRQTTSASIVIDTFDDSRAAMRILAAAGDNFALHLLFMVPSIKVSGKYYDHNRNYEDALPEYLSLVNVSASAVFPLDQASVIENYKNQGVVDSDGSVVSSIRYRTEVFGDAQLIALGVVTAPPVNRRYDPGAVRQVNCDLSLCVPRSIDIEVQSGGATTGAVAYGLNATDAIVRGTSYVNSPAGGTVEMAGGWYLSYHAYINPLVRSQLNATGIPAAQIVIPTAQSGFEHSPSESFIVPTTDAALGYLGGDYFIWDSDPTYVKAFYNTPVLPFRSEAKEDFAFVKHMDSNDHGIGFTNVVSAPVVTTDRKPRIARKEMGEETYSFDSFVNRYQLIRSFQWTDTQVQGTVLDSRSVPYQCIGSTTKAAFNKFVYWNGGVDIKIQVQSTAFVCGKLIVVFAPLCDPERASYLQLPSLTSMSVAPNVTVMAGNTTEVTLNIPYAHYKNYLNTDGEAGDPFSLLGTVSVVVFNKLRAAPGGTDYCTVNLYTRFCDSNFQMLRPPPIDGDVNQHNFVKHGAAMSMAKNVSGVVDDVTDAVSRVGAVAEYALDAPNVGVNYTPVFNRAAPMLNHSTNVHFLNVMDLHPGQQSLADARDVASTIPECTLKYLLGKQSYVNTFRIKEDDIEGEVYMVMPLTPTMKLFNAPASSMVDETLMGYVAAPFKYWRGGFKIIIEAVATSVHTARLVVATHYGGASSIVGMDNILAQNAEILEIGAGQNTFEIIVPWRVPTQWLEVPAGPPESINPFEVTSSARYSMGEVSIRLLTRLQTMPSVSPEIDCNVYVSMLDDAQLAYIGMNTADLIPAFTSNQKVVP